MIHLDQITCSFDGGRTRVVSDPSLEVPEGRTMVLLGTSGCGKTTTLRTINRLVEPISGVVEVAGRPVGDRDPLELRRSIG